MYFNYDLIDGFTDLGDKRENTLAKEMCVFLLRGILSNWKYPIASYSSSKSIKRDQLVLLLKETISISFEIGFNVRSITADQGPNNRKCCNLRDVNMMYHISRCPVT